MYVILDGISKIINVELKKYFTFRGECLVA